MTDDETPSKREPASERRLTEQDPPGPTGETTTLYFRRVHQEIHAPLIEVLAACERLIGQARRMGRDYLLVPNLMTIEKAARDLVERLSDSQKAEARKAELGAVVSALGQAEEGAASTAKHGPMATGSILLVDDSERTRAFLSVLLEQKGHRVTLVHSGESALEAMRQRNFDLVLLDILLPGIDGFAVLEAIKSDSKLDDIPVIMVSGEVHMDILVRCIEAGAEDFLPKPLNPKLLSARIEAGLEKKRLRDQEARFVHRLQTEQEKSERLLLNILPKPIADRLKHGETTIADSFANVTVMFADVVGFTEYSTRVSPAELVRVLNELFSGFDRLVGDFGMEKIKSIGDEYMVVSGLPTVRKDHAEAIVAMALEMLDQVAEFNRTHGTAINIRIGIHTGQVVAGVIGQNKFAYDLWGETVNIAHRMQTRGVAGKIQLSEATRSHLPGTYPFEPVRIHVKGKGEMQTYLLSRRE